MAEVRDMTATARALRFAAIIFSGVTIKQDAAR